MIIAANWKMHKTVPETLEFLEEFKSRSKEISREVRVVICPPFTSLYAAREKYAGEDFALGAQNVHWEKEGAFTGEVSPLMLKDAGISHVIVGHSERRHIMGESDEVINKKLKTILDHGFIPIFCVGETEEEREKGLTEEVLQKQVKQGLQDINKESLEGLVVAYEPVWAIGTGRAAYPEDARQAAQTIRRAVNESGAGQGDSVEVLYGGSVKSNNIAQFVSLKEIQGALVGGASLQAGSFVELIKAAQEQEAG